MIQISGYVTELERHNVLRKRSAPHLTTSIARDAIVPSVQVTCRSPLSFKGGVYDGGKLLQSSALRRGWAGVEHTLTEAYDWLPEVTKSSNEAVFGGYIFTHFGHFMLESMTRVWWAVENDFRGPVLFQTIGDKVPQFARKLIDMAGLDAVFVSGDECWEVRNLIVPDVALVERSWANPRWKSPFRKIRDFAESTAEHSKNDLLFVSRGSGTATVHGETEIQQELQKQGYKTLDPGNASIEEQIIAFSRARKIVGFVGSAMHNVVYSNRVQHVAYLMRGQSVSASFPIIDQCIGQYDSTYVYAARTPLPLKGNLAGPYFVDAEECCMSLFDAGLLSEKPQIDLRALIRARDDYMADWMRIE